MILGIDEVGRGPWAGPLVVGAVVLNGAQIEGLGDSKALSKKRREKLYQKIHASNASVGLGWVHADELDRIGLSKSLIEATKRAVKAVKAPYHEIIIDGTVNFLKDTPLESYVTTLKKADALIASVSAASIMAKVARDDYMSEQSRLYPEYGFASHVGYGTAVHRAAIDTYGLTPLHRRSFAGLDAVRKRAEATTTAIGNAGEDAASVYLTENGFVTMERNWKIRTCEIDIVASKGGMLYFVEVKHRKDATRGGGIAAITPKKLRQMIFSARMYMHFHHLVGDMQLAVITTEGTTPRVTTMLELTD